MADAIVSVVLERLAATLEEQIMKEVSLVSGVENEIQSLSAELNTVRKVLGDAEKRGYKDESIKDWLTRLENTAYEMDDVLDEWNYSILKFQMEQHSNDVAADYVPLPKKKVWSFIQSPCLCFKKVINRHNIALKIKEVKSRLDLILSEKDRFGFEIRSQPTEPSGDRSWRVQTTSLIDLEEVCGRESESENLVTKLVGEEELGICVLSLVGVGGLGKTTLAKLAYNHTRVEKHFELRIWICVSDPFDEVEIAKGIVSSVKKVSAPSTNQLEMVLQCLKEAISGKKFLLVLDDVWAHDNAKWQPLKSSLKCGGAGSKVLVTTRNERVAIMMGTVENNIHLLGHLSHKDCWFLLGQIALYGKNKEECEKFEKIGKEIAEKCKGLPLAAKTLGSLLCFKNSLEEWENVLNSEIWELEEVEVDLFPHLLLSYNELSPALKRCFSYCAVFPKDATIHVENLIEKWVAMGYLGNSRDWKLKGREYFDMLAMCSLFQDFTKGQDSEDQHQIILFKMHDIVHDFAQFLRKNAGSRINKTTCLTCDPLSVSHVQRYQSLFHYNKDLPLPHVCDFLTRARLLDLKNCGLEGIPKEMEKLIHLRWLDLTKNFISYPKSISKLYNLQFLWLRECGVVELPHDIGNLIHLIHLDLGWNPVMRDLPESLCNLHALETLVILFCQSLDRLPQGIGKLKKLKHVYNDGTFNLKQYPQGVAELTNLVTMMKTFTVFDRRGGRDQSKLGWLKNLNQLSGYLPLTVEISSDDSVQGLVEDAHEAELRKKTHIRKLQIHFAESTMGGSEEVKESMVSIDILDALEPHPNLQGLVIVGYKGSRLPQWIASPLNQTTSIILKGCAFLSSLPPLGQLPLLKTLCIRNLTKLEVVGREFLGITSSSSSTGTIIGGFPRLQKLKFQGCAKWKEWEDITDREEEDFVAVSIMPCLMSLKIKNCEGLIELPQRLLQKMSSSLKLVDISGSTQLEQVYEYE